MLSKSEIQLLSKLKQKKFRQSEQQFIAEGKRLVSEGLKSSINCLQILISSDFRDREEKYLNKLKSHSKKMIVLSNKDFGKIANTKNPQGIAAVFQIPYAGPQLFDDKIIVCLENISDPGNVGTILRTCDWFGIKSVILSEGCADIYNPKVLRASMGAVFNLKIRENADLVKTINEVKTNNYKTYFADMEGYNYRDVDYSPKTLITFCNASSTSPFVSISRSVVASSKIRIGVSRKAARAIAILNICPPDSLTPLSPTRVS